MIVPQGASTVHKIKPYIAEYRNFFTPKQCKAIMKLRKQLSFTQGQLRIDGQRQINLDQRNAFTHIVTADDPVALTRWPQHVADWLGLPSVQWIENTLLIHYPDGGEFKLHTDVVSTQLKNGNISQRQATLIVYINDDYQHGRTVFPYQNVEVSPETGKALLFFYNYQDTAINDTTVHLGQKVTGNKYIMVFFIRDLEYPDYLRAISHY